MHSLDIKMNSQVLVSLLIDKKICSEEDIKGCTSEEVVQLEQSSGLSLPAQYKEFLFAVGHGAGRFFLGTDIFLLQIKGLREEAVNLLNENDEEFRLPETVFVFLMHQGYEFCFFNTQEGSDPPVYQYVEGNGLPVLTWQSFSEFLEDSISWHA